MSKTEPEPDPQAVTPLDTTPGDLRSWGLSNRAMRMAPADWVPVVAALRDVNVGKSPTASAQPLLDAAFPGRGYQAADLVAGGVPTGTFTYTKDNTPVGQRTFTADDAGLNLPFEHYQWDFGDGYRGTGAVAPHVYTQRGRYTVVLTVNMAGQSWSSVQAVPSLGGPLPTITSINPRSAVIGAPDLTVSVKGTEFVSGKTDIYVGETKRATTFVSPTEVTTLVTPSNPAAQQLGTLPVSVLVQGVGRSNAVGFDVFPAGSTTPTVMLAEQYDPGAHTVDDVLAHAQEHPDELDALIGAEEVGKARVTLLEKLHAMSANATS